MGQVAKKVCFTCEKICFFRLAPSFIHACGKNLLNGCGKQEKTCRKKISEFLQKFDKFLPQAVPFFSILEFFYECVICALSKINLSWVGIDFPFKCVVITNIFIISPYQNIYYNKIYIIITNIFWIQMEKDRKSVV